MPAHIIRSNAKEEGRVDGTFRENLAEIRNTESCPSEGIDIDSQTDSHETFNSIDLCGTAALDLCGTAALGMCGTAALGMCGTAALGGR